MDGERYMSVREAAERYQLSHSTLWRWIRNGKLPAVRMGKVVRVPESAFSDLPAYRKEER
jgi:excisionase family DNA binding protein